jgi:hypothetical protein
VSYPIIHISNYSSSNEIKDRVVVFVPLQPTLGRVVKCIRDHVHLMNDLPSGATLTQKIVASLVFSVTEFLIIEDHKLNNTFL